MGGIVPADAWIALRSVSSRAGRPEASDRCRPSATAPTIWRMSASPPESHPAQLSTMDWRGVGIVAGVTAGLLLLLSGRYGYHRDELYFLASGRHLAWGYPDQPPFVPFLARLMSGIDAHSLVVLRVPSDLAVAGTILLTGGIARELGARAGGQRLAAVGIAISGYTLGSGHLLSTSTFQLTAWAALLLITVRVFRTNDQRLWPLAGVIAGIGLLDNSLVAFLAAAVGVGVLAAGPRRVFVSPWLWVGVLIAAALWSPYLIWQAQHGWPELSIAHSIANGGSGTSTSRVAIPIQQFDLASPPLVPIWITGLVVLFRNGRLRCMGIAYVVLLIVFLVTGGKPYYLANMFPLLLAAGSQPAVDWAAQAVDRRRGWGIAIGVGAVIDAVITLPIVPLGVLHDTPIVAVNYDAGETVAWPTYVAQIGVVVDGLQRGGRRPVVLASNYGEAGAVERYGGADMQTAYSGQNAYWLWGPPPSSATTVVAVGFSRGELQPDFQSVALATHLNNQEQISDDEQQAPVWVCSGLKQPWTALWPRLRDYGG